jgi:hypothetical protein
MHFSQSTPNAIVSLLYISTIKHRHQTKLQGMHSYLTQRRANIFWGINFVALISEISALRDAFYNVSDVRLCVKKSLIVRHTLSS